MNIQEILNYKPPTETYYDILGCDQSSSVEQISKEYKIRALELHPDKNPDPQSLEKFRKLQTAKDVLCDVASRRSYDSWLSSKIHIPFEQWQKRKGHSMHWASPKSMNLRLKEGDNRTGQGSELQHSQHGETTAPASARQQGSLVDKFRQYEI